MVTPPPLQKIGFQLPLSALSPSTSRTRALKRLRPWVVQKCRRRAPLPPLHDGKYFLCWGGGKGSANRWPWSPKQRRAFVVSRFHRSGVGDRCCRRGAEQGPQLAAKKPRNRRRRRASLAASVSPAAAQLPSPELGGLSRYSRVPLGGVSSLRSWQLVGSLSGTASRSQFLVDESPKRSLIFASSSPLPVAVVSRSLPDRRVVGCGQCRVFRCGRLPARRPPLSLHCCSCERSR